MKYYEREPRLLKSPRLAFLFAFFRPRKKTTAERSLHESHLKQEKSHQQHTLQKLVFKRFPTPRLASVFDVAVLLCVILLRFML
jgi:hypothetical protein